ncbi:MAG: tetratricopeptide repeat protein [candidate division Zixibacteria bacterium]|nr:tetratricopeptide repeat protein [candidate division Zixibacteria bacterium]
MFMGINRKAFEREADNYLSEGKIADAVFLIENNTPKLGISTSGAIVYAQCLYAQKRYRKARRILEKVIAIHPESPAALELLTEICEKTDDTGSTWYYKNRLKEATAFLDECRAFWEHEERQVTHKALTKEELINSINDLLGSDINRRWPFETKTLAELFIKQGHPKKGLAVYSRLLQKESESAELRGRVLELIRVCSGENPKNAANRTSELNDGEEYDR